MSKWQKFLANIDNSTEVLRVAMVGKYVGLEDAYYSLNEGLKCAGFAHQKKVKLEFIEAEEIERELAESREQKSGSTSETIQTIKLLEGFDGICIPGGFGTRGTEGMIAAARYARTNKIPYLGVCLGSQIMAIEFARDVLGIADASSEEFTPEGQNNIIHIMDHQKELTTKGGNMRLGSYPCVIREGTLAERVYLNLLEKGGGTSEMSDGGLVVSERHRHRFEFNPLYREQMEAAGFIVSATSPDGMLAEVVELRDHPYMIATQAHPELISRPTHPHPLFMGFVEAMVK